MKFRLIYPKWSKLSRQTEFHLPPHGPVVFAATLPEDVEVDFIDENVQALSYDDPVDFVGISMMLSSQVKRGWDIADEYRRRGVPVIFGVVTTDTIEQAVERAGTRVSNRGAEAALSAIEVVNALKGIG